jgi:16S rRNA G966 N2-methylase RsmD
MRITSGIWGGRQVCVPKGPVRPTQDRVREALFSILQSRIGGASFLDLYAGSGAVGLDALSRGAARVCWVEGDRKVFDVLRRNVCALLGDCEVRRKSGPSGDDSAFREPDPNRSRSADPAGAGEAPRGGRGEGGRIRSGVWLEAPELNADLRLEASDAIAFLKRSSVGESFDLIFADPPYNKDGRGDLRRRPVSGATALLSVLAQGGGLARGGWVVVEQGADEAVQRVAGWAVADEREYGGTRLVFYRREEGEEFESCHTAPSMQERSIP